MIDGLFVCCFVFVFSFFLDEFSLVARCRFLSRLFESVMSSFGDRSLQQLVRLQISFVLLCILFYCRAVKHNVPSLDGLLTEVCGFSLALSQRYVKSTNFTNHVVHSLHPSHHRKQLPNKPPKFIIGVVCFLLLLLTLPNSSTDLVATNFLDCVMQPICSLFSLAHNLR